MEDIKSIIWPTTPFNLIDHSILVGYRGSQAHGFPAASRRVYYQLNVSSIHAGWNDEYGRSFSEGAE